jgi:phthiocerol/phenolphthiocerol synthesis type-I polyketide synthase E
MGGMKASNPRTGLEVAVIGMAGRFPGAKNIQEFWDNLKNGVESISFFSDIELEKTGVSKKLLENPNFVKSKGVITGSDYFDSSFFNYTSREAELMDPQVRIFHECAWEALEDAGYDPGNTKGRVGLYAGASSNQTWEGLCIFSGKGSEIEGGESGSLMDKDYMSVRISYKLNLKGPSFIMQSACSTSLAAVHLGCRALLTGECDTALVGGVCIPASKMLGYIYQEGMSLSRDGHCRAFDADASGTVGGEGIGIAVLKRLDDAAAARDNIYAVVKGSVINNDGKRKIGFSAPSIDGQAECIRSALHLSQIAPERISYVEAHGTGTTLGDPIEIEALKLAFNTKKKQYCRIG